MIKGLMREVTLAIQAKTGASAGVVIFLVLGMGAAVTSFAFFCVAAYQWLVTLFGHIFGGLIEAGFFLLVAAIAAIMSLLIRQHTKQSAILERATRQQPGGWLLDPKLLTTALQVGRTIGWQRIVPVVLLGFVATQWAREYRGRDADAERD